MTAEAFEVRPPSVAALRWTPGDFDTVARFLTWAEFAGADPAIEKRTDQPEPITGSTIITIRPDPFRTGRCYVHPGEWVVLDQRYGGRFIVRNARQFDREYRRQQ